METITAPLKGKVALVTGASRGIGASIAETFARNGCTHIALTYNSNKKMMDEVEGRIAQINSKIKTYSFAMDVCDPQSGKTAVEHSLKGLGVDHLDIVVSGAAMADPSTFVSIGDMSKEKWDQMMTANAWTPFVLARESAKVMAPGGRIVMLSTGSSKMPSPDPIFAYGVSKAAMDAVIRGMAAQFGLQSNGITINGISIGPVDTDSLRSGIRTMGPKFKDMVEDFPLLKRIAAPQEIADIVTFVASPSSSNITGNQIPANGGGLAVLQG